MSIIKGDDMTSDQFLITWDKLIIGWTNQKELYALFLWILRTFLLNERRELYSSSPWSAFGF